jgi:hypothetical protein
MGADMSENFLPPDEGLNPGEEIVWSRQARMNPRNLCGSICCIASSYWILLIVYIFFDLIVVAALFVVVLIGILYTIAEFRNTRRTRYYLTSERLIEVRGGEIHIQIQLGDLQNPENSENTEIRETYRDSAEAHYQAKFLDPKTGRVMILTGLDEYSKDLILRKLY